MSSRTRPWVRAALGLVGVMMSLPLLAGAPIVYSPGVARGQTEFEYRSGHAHVNGQGTEHNYAFAVGHAFTSWWRPEVYVGRFERDSAGTTHFAGMELENIFQLTATGQYWADAGFLLAYEFNPASLESDKVEFGPLFEKQSGRVTQRLNLTWEKGVGPGSNAKYDFLGAYSFRYAVRKSFAPGFEAFIAPTDNDYRIGPVVYGEKLFGMRGSELGYSAGLLLPLTADSPDSTLVIRLEYEFY